MTPWLSIYSTKAGAGVRPERTDAFKASLQEMLKRLTPRPTPENRVKAEDCHCLVLAVWPDSYKEATILRDMAAQLGFAYALMLVKPGQSIEVGEATIEVVDPNRQ